MNQSVLISFLGTTLDRKGKYNNRWDKWRPSVGICQQKDILFDHYYILYPGNENRLCSLIVQDIKEINPTVNLIPVEMNIDDPWDFQEVYGALFDFSKTLKNYPEDTDFYVHITTGTHVAQICLFLLTESRHFPGKIIQTSPPDRSADTKEKTEGSRAAGRYTVIDLDLSKYDQLFSRFERERLDDISFLKSGIKTRNRAFNSLIEEIETVGIRSTNPILLYGQTGAGKSQLARRIYELKKHHKKISGSFIEINCATLHGDQAMSALFGHKKGSFTGAVSDRAGLLKLADNGICFLDEIGELGLNEQAILLRAIEEKVFLPLGAEKEEYSNFQLICGTNRELKNEVAAGRFREDLLARIDLWTFKLPPLKERKEDIEPNIDYELADYSEKEGRIISMNSEARDLFLNFAVSAEAEWKSNFRDLNGAIVRMGTLAEGGRIGKKEVRAEIARLKQYWSDGNEIGSKQYSCLELLGKSISGDLDLFDKMQLEAVLNVCIKSDSISEAGRKLYDISRLNKQKTNDADRLAKFLNRFGLKWADVKTLKRKLLY